LKQLLPVVGLASEIHRGYRFHRAARPGQCGGKLVHGIKINQACFGLDVSKVDFGPAVGHGIRGSGEGNGAADDGIA
jgi:hypothetical protein